MTKLDIHGINAALPTPMQADGTVDEAQLRRLVTYLLDSGIHGIVPVGGTGEYTALSPAERLRVVEVTVEAVAGRVPVMAGILSPGFGEAVAAGKDFTKAGADALMVVTPFYVTPTQAGIRDYFKAYRDNVDLPVLAYDIPYRTRIAAEPETLVAMHEDGSIVGMKESSLDIAHFNRVAAAMSPDFSLLSGEEPLFPVHMALGAKGGVLAVASMLPKVWIEIYTLAASGKIKEAIQLQRNLLPLFAALFAESNPGPLKKAMQLAGFPVGAARRPFVAPSETTLAALNAALDELRQSNLLAAA
jgi:4-hydroxy-tetrahydrodipicolinate synthase